MDQKKKILLIDDDVLVSKTLKRYLEAQGYSVLTAQSGEEAIKTLKINTVDLIVSDIRMPGIDGIKTITQLRFEEIGKKVPVIFITGYASEEAPIDAFKLEAEAYILKPFNNDELLSSVKRAIECPSFSQDQNLDSLVKSLRNLIDNFESKNEKDSYSNETLRSFLDSLNKIVFNIEKKLLQNQHFDSKTQNE